MNDAHLTVLVADDHPLLRRGLCTVIAAADGMEVAGEAATGTDAVAAAASLKPDVILMDLHMPELGGIEATRRIVAARPEARVLVLTMVEEDDSVFAAMRAGARGYLLKGSDKDELLRAVRAVASGEAIFGPGVAERLSGLFATGAQAPQPFSELTSREREVLEGIARGENNADIAAALGLSLKTVRNHVSNVFTKLRVTDRAQAIVKAREAGLGRPSEGAGFSPGSAPRP